MTDQEQYNAIADSLEARNLLFVDTQDDLDNLEEHNTITKKFLSDYDIFCVYHPKQSLRIRTKLFMGSRLEYKLFKEVQKFKNDFPEYFI